MGRNDRARSEVDERHDTRLPKDGRRSARLVSLRHGLDQSLGGIAIDRNGGETADRIADSGVFKSVRPDGRDWPDAEGAFNRTPHGRPEQSGSHDVVACVKAPARTVSAIVALSLGLGRLVVAIGASPADEGRVAFNNSCRTCHSLKAGDNRLGPSLHGIVGAKAAQSPGYGYSQSLRQSGVTWNEATLERWIENPEAVVPNNNMKPYNGLADAAVRKKIVEFLRKNDTKS